MGNKIFYIVVAVLVSGLVAFVVLSPAPEKEPRAGVAHEDQGREHLRPGETIEYGGPEPPTSGTHSPQPYPWDVYEQEILDHTVLHNLEHGGIYVSYQPDLPQEQVDKLRALFFEQAVEGFDPVKVIMAPRSANDTPIILSSWLRSQKFDSYDEEAMITYYRTNLNESPEPHAQ